jgi:hypothetical protein
MYRIIKGDIEDMGAYNGVVVVVGRYIRFGISAGGAAGTCRRFVKGSHLEHSRLTRIWVIIDYISFYSSNTNTPRSHMEGIFMIAANCLKA